MDCAAIIIHHNACKRHCSVSKAISTAKNKQIVEGAGCVLSWLKRLINQPTLFNEQAPHCGSAPKQAFSDLIHACFVWTLEAVLSICKS
eukprot:scaffold273560_cov12-Tisochrysis_lutea.AAC.1